MIDYNYARLCYSTERDVGGMSLKKALGLTKKDLIRFLKEGGSDTSWRERDANKELDNFLLLTFKRLVGDTFIIERLPADIGESEFFIWLYLDCSSWVKPRSFKDIDLTVIADIATASEQEDN